MIIEFPPALILLSGIVLIPAFTGWARKAIVILLPLLTLLAVWQVPAGASFPINFLSYTLDPLHVSTAGRLFASIFSLAALMGGLFAMNHSRPEELAFAALYAGSAVGVTFSADLVSMFVFWEIMAIGSTAVIWCGKTPASYHASMRYLMIHLLGGVLLMVGIIGHITETGSVAFTRMQLDSVSSAFILAGFLVNAGAPPLSVWIADAYPEASPGGAVFLSAFTTKTAVFALLTVFPGTWLLVPIGLYMIFYGIIYALLENDARRILSYSIVNQVGFMVTGIGIGTEMALNGAAAHAFAHIIYKGLLLMTAGVVLLQTGKRKCTELGGLYQSMPITTICSIVGALAISAFPFTSGFISKSMITQSAIDQHLAIVWFLLVAASAGVFLHAGIKFPWFVFFQKDSGLRPKDPSWNMTLAMIVMALLCVGLGVFPNMLYGLLPFPVDYEPYTASHLVSQFQLLLFAGLAFFVLLPLMKRTNTISLDIDWLYRKLLPIAGKAFFDTWWQFSDAFRAFAMRLINRFVFFMSLHHAEQGVFAKTRPISVMVFWVAAMLAMSLLLAYL